MLIKSFNIHSFSHLITYSITNPLTYIIPTKSEFFHTNIIKPISKCIAVQQCLFKEENKKTIEKSWISFWVCKRRLILSLLPFFSPRPLNLKFRNLLLKSFHWFPIIFYVITYTCKMNILVCKKKQTNSSQSFLSL